MFKKIPNKEGSNKKCQNDIHSRSEIFSNTKPFLQISEELGDQKNTISNEEDCEKILDYIGNYNPYSMFIMTTMSVLWGLAAMNLMISAFVVDPTYTKDLPNNIIIEFDLKNERAYLADMFSSSFMIGSVVGGAIIPIFADYYGRKSNVAWSTLITGVSGCLIAFVNKYYLVVILRFLQGLAFNGIISTNWVLSYECVTVKVRSYSALIFGVVWVVGYCVIGPLAYYFTNWRHLCIAAASPSILFSFVVFLTIPESLGFLIMKKDFEGIKNWITKCKTFCKKCGNYEFPNIDNLLENLHNHVDVKNIEEEKKDVSMIKRLKNIITNKKLLIIQLIIFAFIWTTDNIIYFALSFFSTNLSGNIYINYVLSGLIECPSYLVVPLFLEYLGRRGLTFSMHLISSIALFLGIIISEENNIIYLLIWLTGKFCISCTFTSLFVYGSEIFPTSSRNISLGFCGIVSRFGGVLVPYTKSLDFLYPKLSILLYASITFFAALISLVLPETGKIKKMIILILI
uniref:MFS domain-containing protein n=1 Tax=Parastrongyloides trichosuri TaxID=131310 RepID=A0A0N4Z4H5_PARTI